MSKTWRRVSKDERAAWGNRRQRAPRREQFEDDFANTRGNKRTATKHITLEEYEDDFSYSWDDDDAYPHS